MSVVPRACCGPGVPHCAPRLLLRMFARARACVLAWICGDVHGRACVCACSCVCARVVRCGCCNAAQVRTRACVLASASRTCACVRTFTRVLVCLRAGRARSCACAPAHCARALAYGNKADECGAVRRGRRRRRRRQAVESYSDTEQVWRPAYNVSFVRGVGGGVNARIVGWGGWGGCQARQ